MARLEPTVISGVADERVVAIPFGAESLEPSDRFSGCRSGTAAKVDRAMVGSGCSKVSASESVWQNRSPTRPMRKPKIAWSGKFTGASFPGRLFMRSCRGRELG
jgi:hypothetical protein